MDIFDRINSLDRKIVYLSWKFHTPSMPAEDLHQEMIVGIIEKAEKYDLANQTDAYILKLAEWIGRNKRSASLCYNRHTVEEWFSNEDDDISVFWFFPNNDRNVEEQLIHRERFIQLANIVHGTDRVIVRMLVCGYPKSEIAERLKVSRPAISQHIKKISLRLKELEGVVQSQTQEPK